MTRGAQVSYHDPYVSRFHVGGDVFHRRQVDLVSQPLTEASLKSADCVIIVTGHRAIDYAFVVRNARAVVDCCNVTDGVDGDLSRVIRLGNGVKNRASYT
jgi:UDP-N-acetyl-D-glucosamine dehydrogenase